MTSTEEFRIEHDTMGEVRVPVNALYRAQTQRAVENFPISGKTLEPAHIEALARVKKAAAQANAELGVLDGELAKAIAAAADEVATGKYDGDFPIDVFQTGSGTSSNMNTNEVIAELATDTALVPAGALLVSAGPEVTTRSPEELRNDVTSLLEALQRRRSEAPAR